MNSILSKIFNFTFPTALAILSLGILFKILHYAFSNFLILTGLLFVVIYTIVALKEIHNSNLSFTNKAIWTVGFLAFNFIAATLFFFGRKELLLVSNRDFK
ncbi:MAG: hypothetical protein KA327_02885 [Pseudarcicella sp.]|nr:hypothetical protein [Pseudarcicella sp.]